MQRERDKNSELSEQRLTGSRLVNGSLEYFVELLGTPMTVTLTVTVTALLPLLFFVFIFFILHFILVKSVQVVTLQNSTECVALSILRSLMDEVTN